MVKQRQADAGVRKGAETIDLQEEGSRGVLLLHGFGDTPQTLALLARRLYKAGYSVLAPLLPGHGRTMSVFRRSNADEWVAAAERALAELRSRNKQTSLAAATHWLWGALAGEINARNPRSIRDPIEREKNLAYGAVTASTLHQLSKVVKRARKALPAVTAPTLIVQSRDDPRIAPAVAEFVLKELGATEKRLVWTEGAGHIITVDYGRERIFSEVERWLDAHASRGATAATR
jgi:carboxylesterase